MVIDGGIKAAPSVVDVEPLDPDRVRVLLSRSVEIRAWTTITHNNSGTNVRVGFLPGDVNGDTTSNPTDIFELIDALTKINPSRMIWSTDIDRSGLTMPGDILRLIDLLNGAGADEPFNGASLP